jgi:putative transposase
MPRKPRSTPAGYVYHVWNRAAGRLRLFRGEGDYLAFEAVLREAHGRVPLPILDWCLMRNHWHFVVRPRTDGQVTAFFRWLTHTHAMRVRAFQRNGGIGPLYQGRFKALPVQADGHLRTLLRYVERNPVRANAARSALAWRWGSAHVRLHGPAELAAVLSPWPVPRPRDWATWVDAPQTPAELEAIRTAVRRSRPFGDADWTRRTAGTLGLQWTLRDRGRPRKAEAPAGTAAE